MKKYRLIGVFLVAFVAAFAGHAAHSDSFSSFSETRIRDIDWSPDGTKIAVGNSVSSVQIFTSDLKQEIAYINTLFIEDLEWSPDGQKLAVVVITSAETNDLGIQIWDVPTVKLQRTIPIERANVLRLAWSPDGQKLAVAAATLSIYDTTTGALVQTLFDDYQIAVDDVAWSPDGNYIAGATSRHGLMIWETNAWTVFKDLSDPPGAYPIAWSSDNTIISAQRFDPAPAANGDIELWNVLTGEHLARLDGPGHSIFSLDWASHTLASAQVTETAAGRTTGFVALWDMRANSLAEGFATSGVVYAVSLSPDGRYVAYNDGNERAVVQNVDFYADD